MSLVSATRQSEFDFWDFVACTKCQLPFSTDSGVVIPFWLTECGHVVCNAHLNADQSCAQCGSSGIQLAPLQREMEPPMSEWFRSVSHTMESAAYAVKFQQETMASQIRYYRTRHQQLRIFVERLKRDVAELKKMNEILSSRNEQLQHKQGHARFVNALDSSRSSEVLNPNGKRQMIPAPQYDHRNGMPMAGSSPRSAVTPLGPTRLTLPPGQPVQELSSHEPSSNNDMGLHPNPYSDRTHLESSNGAQLRPPSSRLMEQYAYVPPETPQMHLPQLSLAQAVPKSFQRQKGAHNGLRDVQQRHTHALPTTSSRSIPDHSLNNKQLGAPRVSSATIQRQRKQTNMGPPPTPQHLHQQTQANSRSNLNETSLGSGSSGSPILRVHATQRFFNVPDTAKDPRSSTSAPQRFFGHPTASTHVGTSLQVSPPGSRALSRGSLPTALGQRMPFVPAASSLNYQRGFG